MASIHSNEKRNQIKHESSSVCSSSQPSETVSTESLEQPRVYIVETQSPTLSIPTISSGSSSPSYHFETEAARHKENQSFYTRTADETSNRIKVESHKHERVTDDEGNRPTKRQRKSDGLDVGLLINQIQYFPCLWNPKSPYTKDFGRRKYAWAQINQSIDGEHSVDCLKKVWKNCKDNYRSCRERRRTNVNKTGSLPTCRYYKQLQFLENIYTTPTMLRDYVTPSQAMENFDGNCDNNNEVEGERSGQSNVTTPLLISVSSAFLPTTTCSNSKDQKISKLKNTDIQQTGDYVNSSNSLNNGDTRKNRHDESSNNDSDVMFCRSLINRLKGLPMRKNRLARIRIEEALFSLECDE